MIPPKYNFYVGRNVYAIFYDGETIDDNGEYTDNSSACASNKVKIGTKSLFLDVNPVGPISAETNRIYVHCYNDDVYLGKVYTAGNEIVELYNDTNQIALSFYRANDDIYRKSQNEVTFIYYVQSVNPHYKDLSKKYAKESNQEFFRISLDGKINLFGQDFEFVNNSDLENKLIFICNKYNRIAKKWIGYYKGEFNKTDCKFDYDKKKCELKTTAIDAYNEVINKYENTYDLIKLAPAITQINLHKRSLMQVYIRGANSITNFFGGIYWEDDVDEAIDDHETLINKYYFAYLKAGNEFYVKNAGISGVNGVYAGIDGYWPNWNGYTCKMELAEDSTTQYWIRIYRNSDNVILYQSEKKWGTADPNNRYIGRDNIKLINVSDSTDTFTIESPFVYHIYRRLLCDVDTVEDSEGTKSTYDLPANDFVTDNRNYKKCIGLTGGAFFCTSRAVDEPTKYGLNDYGKYFTNEFIPSTSGLGRALPISKNSWANASLWYVYDTSYEIFEKRLRKQYTLKDSYSIAVVIKALLNKIDPTLKHEATAEYSHFLYDENVPINMSRFYVCITQKTNILKGDYDQPAQKAEITLKEVMEMLRDCFRCYWYIENGKFKIEHISFFMKGGSYTQNSSIQLDFTKLTDQFNKKLSSYFQSEIEYDKSNLSQRYEFNWMDDVTDLFGGLSIDVKSNYIQKDKNEEINVGQFSSDVDFMLFDPSNFSDDGFALLCPIKNGASYELPIVRATLIDENGDSYAAIVQNWYASWAYLVRFYMYDMPAASIKCNALSDLLVNSTKACMEHTIEFPTENDLHELELIKTSVGNGKIDEYSVNMNTRVAKVKLTYRPQ